MQSAKSSLFIIFVIVFSVIAISKLFQPGFISLHDNTQVARVFEMHQTLKDGMIPARWVSDLGYGYGYPIFTFYAPLAYYVGALFMFFGAPAVFATKLMMGSGFVLAGVTMYFFAKEFWGNRGGYVAGLLYALAPYHGANLFIRGAIAEMWAYGFAPLAFYGIWKFSQTRTWPFLFIGVIGVAGVIISHNLTALMIMPLLIALAVAVWIQGGRTRYSAFGFIVLVVGLLVSAFYWLPAFTQTSFTNVASQVTGGSVYKDHFVCLSQLWSSPVGFAGSGPGCIDGISFQLGKIHIFLLLVSFLGSFILLRNKKYFYPLILSQIVAALGIFLTLEISKPLWDSIPLMKYFQFPWRFEALFLLGSSFSAGALLRVETAILKKYKLLMPILMILFSIVVLVVYQKFLLPQPYPSDGEKQISRDYIRQKVSRTSDEYMPSSFMRPKTGDYVKDTFPSSLLVSVTILEHKTQYIKARFVVQKSDLYVTNIAYYPAWQAFINGKRTDVFSQKGRLGLNVPRGASVVEFRYISTFNERLGNTFSLGGIFLLTVGIMCFRGRNKHEK